MLHRSLSALLAVTASVVALSAVKEAYATEYLTLAAGQYNALRSNHHAFLYGGEYRFNEWQYGIRPMVGAFGTTDSAAYGYAGLNWDIPLLTDKLYVIPNFAVGAYHQGDGKDLGGALEFRSGIELAYQFPNQHRLGVALNHLSNASLYDKNPGEENVIVTYSIPVGNLLR